MKLFLFTVALALASAGENPWKIEPLNAAEQAELRTAREDFEAAKARLREVERRIKERLGERRLCSTVRVEIGATEALVRSTKGCETTFTTVEK